MAEFESILPYIDRIEGLLKEKKSPKTIAGLLGIQEKWMTIHRYKKKYFDIQDEASTEWMGEQQKPHEQRKQEGKEAIISNFELLNLRKKRAKELLDINMGDKEGDGVVTKGLAAVLWAQADKIANNAIKQEQELAGDTAEDRKADALQDLTDVQLRAIIEATSEPTEEEAE
jgi:hypothetical protein